MKGLRGRGMMAGGVAVMAAGVFAFARFTGPAEMAVAEPTDAAAVADEDTSTAATMGSGAAAQPQPDAVVAEDVAPATEEVAEPLPPVTPEMFELPPITDGVPRMRKPDVVRGLYLNAWAAGSTRKLDKLIGIANRTEINSFVIDVKEAGEVSYDSKVPLVDMVGADRRYVADVRAVLRKLRENGIYPIARIVVFKDPVLAKARPDWAVQHVDGGDWLDADGHRWVDSFNRHVWDYNIAIAREALELGFAEIQWDYVRFPDVPSSLMRVADWPAREGRTKEDAIREFLLYSREQLAEYDAPITADVFGLTVSARDDMGIGQLWEKMVDATDVLLPMVYPSHFARGSYGIPHPNAAPYATVKTAMEWARRRTDDVENAALIRPWLQDFSLGKPAYGPAYVRAQIEAAHDAGIDSWVLWHPGSNYTVEALATEDGVAPQFEIPDPPAEPDSAVADTVNGPLGTPVTVPPDTAG